MKRLLIPSFFLLALGLNGQNFLSRKYNDRYFSVSTGTGTATYFGELNPTGKISGGIDQFNIGIEARLLSKLSARLQGTYCSLAGKDSNAPDHTFERQRNLSFKSRTVEFQFNAIYFLKPYRGNYHSRWNLDPYLFSGVGCMYYNPTTEMNGETFELRKAKTEGISYNKWAWTIPMGIGAKFKLDDFVNFITEVSFHYTFTDYLDDVSGNYATEFPDSTSELLSDRKDEIPPINPAFYDRIVPGARRGDPSNKDHFFLISFKIEVYLPPGLFKFKKPSDY